MHAVSLLISTLCVWLVSAFALKAVSEISSAFEWGGYFDLLLKRHIFLAD
jgi:hypothetical protein